MPGDHDKQPGTITSLLREARAGKAAASDDLFRRVYGELREIARGLIGSKGWPALGLEVTVLVNTACERLLGREQLDAEDRKHFFFLLGRAMHDVLVETVRSEQAAKRGGKHHRTTLIEPTTETNRSSIDIMDLHAALEAFRLVDAEAARVVELRYLAGRTLDETAEILGCSVATVRRNWDYARAWLGDRLSAPARADAPKKSEQNVRRVAHPRPPTAAGTEQPAE